MQQSRSAQIAARIGVTFGVAVAACSPGSNAGTPDASVAPDASEVPPDADPTTGCPAGYAGAACVLALHEAAAAGCALEQIDALRVELDARADLGPLWFGGRALFRTESPVQIAGGFNDWSATALASTALCGSDLVLAVANVPTGHWQYKLVEGGVWKLDPRARAFAYDDFSGNPDGRNSVLNTPDSGRGHLVQLDRACSTTLNNCRDVTAYLPPRYTSPDTADTKYPVMFMHDGQNVWDDHDCCFGHTGWEVNVALDTEIAAGRVAPAIVIAAASTNARNNEYGLSASAMAAFMKFQVEELQPQALAKVRWNGERVAVAGSSLGGLIAMYLGFEYPQTYGAAVALSGAFWPNDEGFRADVPGYGKLPVAVYLDHGGNVATNADGATDTVAVRDALTSLGWQIATSPTCTLADDTLCYFMEPGATHDELAWKARTWRFLRFVFPPP